MQGHSRQRQAGPASRRTSVGQPHARLLPPKGARLRPPTGVNLRQHNSLVPPARRCSTCSSRARREGDVWEDVRQHQVGCEMHLTGPLPGTPQASVHTGSALHTNAQPIHQHGKAGHAPSASGGGAGGALPVSRARSMAATDRLPPPAGFLSPLPPRGRPSPPPPSPPAAAAAAADGRAARRALSSAIEAAMDGRPRCCCCPSSSLLPLDAEGATSAPAAGRASCPSRSGACSCCCAACCCWNSSMKEPFPANSFISAAAALGTAASWCHPRESRPGCRRRRCRCCSPLSPRSIPPADTDTAAAAAALVPPRPSLSPLLPRHVSLPPLLPAVAILPLVRHA
jgi:hypothetical protein